MQTPENHGEEHESPLTKHAEQAAEKPWVLQWRGAGKAGESRTATHCRQK
jgi:hypothetical protein